jgi:hypothetical protein
MKKILLTLFAATVVFAASAQIGKGTILVGGSSNLNFTSNNEDHGDFSEMSLDVRGGYFVMDNLAVGLRLGYDKYKSNADGASDVDAVTTFGVFGRYYVQGKIMLGAGYAITDYGTPSSSALSIEAGYAIFLNDAVAIEPALNYTSFGSDDQGAAFGLNVGISVFLGRK